MKKFVLLFVLLGLCIVAQCEKVTYETHQIYSIQVTNEEHLNVLKTIENSNEDVLFLTPPSTQSATVVAVPKRKHGQIAKSLSLHGIKFDIKMESLQR